MYNSGLTVITYTIHTIIISRTENYIYPSERSHPRISAKNAIERNAQSVVHPCTEFLCALLKRQVRRRNQRGFFMIKSCLGTLRFLVCIFIYGIEWVSTEVFCVSGSPVRRFLSVASDCPPRASSTVDILNHEKSMLQLTGPV
ncbi:hypothetical protein GALMADRAFT_1363705 [Galerina marginata CBS 339.88]|uniref:Uncharacterized protein n=1 Tax=Galerina marginata (strain CBS 339.88) TaxID=685588 RepID=A0A067THM7_GALM3|nr:hypothetical protein GALMADRAFT_1363705 [Galerina marginata CBS 339.88]